MDSHTSTPVDPKGGTKAAHGPTSALCAALVPTSGYKGLDVWEATQSLGSLDGPTQPTRSLRWARRPVGRGARPPPDAWRSCRAARLTHARPLRTACLATPHQRARLYGRQASTLASGASSPWRAPTTRWRAIVTSCPGVLLHVRTSGGGGAVARAHHLSCGRPRAAEPPADVPAALELLGRLVAEVVLDEVDDARRLRAQRPGVGRAVIRFGRTGAARAPPRPPRPRSR